jgi:predicted HTH transcriptional regulator
MAEKAKVQNHQSVAEKLRMEQEETQARLKEQAQNRLSEVREQIGPLQQEETELAEFLGVEEQKPEAPAAAAPRQRRRRKGGTRAEQTIKVVSENPGLTASEIAEKIKIKPNYLYRVLSDLAKRNEIKKVGQQYEPVS